MIYCGIISFFLATGHTHEPYANHQCTQTISMCDQWKTKIGKVVQTLVSCMALLVSKLRNLLTTSSGWYTRWAVCRFTKVTFSTHNVSITITCKSVSWDTMSIAVRAKIIWCTLDPKAQGNVSLTEANSDSFICKGVRWVAILLNSRSAYQLKVVIIHNIVDLHVKLKSSLQTHK